MLHYLLKKIKFEYIELQEILFYNEKINVVLCFKILMYTKNGNILEPEIIPFYLIIYIQYIQSNLSIVVTWGRMTK